MDPDMTAVVVGPCGVRASRGGSAALSGRAAAALAGVDDEFILIDERPVAVAAVWRDLFKSVLDDGAAELICPTRGPGRRPDTGVGRGVLVCPPGARGGGTDTVVAAARAAGPDVAMLRRAAARAAVPPRRSAVVI